MVVVQPIRLGDGVARHKPARHGEDSVEDGPEEDEENAPGGDLGLPIEEQDGIPGNQVPHRVGARVAEKNFTMRKIHAHEPEEGGADGQIHEEDIRVPVNPGNVSKRAHGRNDDGTREPV